MNPSSSFPSPLATGTSSLPFAHSGWSPQPKASYTTSFHRRKKPLAPPLLALFSTPLQSHPPHLLLSLSHFPIPSLHLISPLTFPPSHIPPTYPTLIPIPSASAPSPIHPAPSSQTVPTHTLLFLFAVTNVQILAMHYCALAAGDRGRGGFSG